MGNQAKLRRLLYINRVTSRLGLYDLLRTAIYLARGVSISNTVIIVMVYNLGALSHNLITSKLGIPHKYLMQISSLIKFGYYVSLLFISDLWVFCLSSFLIGLSDTISNTSAEAYCYQINKENHADVMGDVIASATVLTVSLNLLASALFQINWRIPLFIMGGSQIITLVTGMMLPNIKENNAATTKGLLAQYRLENIKDTFSNKKVLWLAILTFAFKLFIIVFIRVKPYMLRSLPYSVSVLGYIDTAGQLGAVFAPKRKYNLNNIIKLFSFLCMGLMVAAVTLPTQMLIPALLITPIAGKLVFPLLSQHIGKNSRGIRHMGDIMTTIDVGVNIGLITLLYIMSILYETKPFYYGYFIALPLMVITFISLYKLKQLESEGKDKLPSVVNLKEAI